MARKHHDKGRLDPFVPLLIDTLDTPAWRSLSHGAQMLYVALKRRYNRNSRNNGRIFLSQRLAAKELRSNHNRVARWYRELQHYGFIVKHSEGYLGVDGRARAWLHARTTDQGLSALEWPAIRGPQNRSAHWPVKNKIP
jgi:hypothetical protein